MKYMILFLEKVSFPTFRFDCSEETKTTNEEKETTSIVFSASNPNNGEGVCKMSICLWRYPSWAFIRPESNRNASKNLVSKSTNKVEERNPRKSRRPVIANAALLWRKSRTRFPWDKYSDLLPCGLLQTLCCNVNTSLSVRFVKISFC